MKLYTIDQIRNYLTQQDSMGDALYNLTEERIDAANIPINTDSEAYREGMEEYVDGKKMRNPYSYGSQESKEYAAGWNAKEEEYS